MAFLLDVNVIIALIDPAHVHHQPAHDWFASSGRTAFATCPLTENGVLRIVGHPRYPNGPGTPMAAAESLAGLRDLAGHEFWPDDISLLDDTMIDRSRLLASSQITDTYLLALARSRNGQLATFDGRIVVDAIRGDAAASVSLIG